MKRPLYSAVGVALFASILLSGGCKDDNDLDRPKPGDSDTPPAQEETTRVKAPSALVGSLPTDDLGQALGERFTISGSPESSSVVLFTGASLSSASSDVLKGIYDGGKLIVVVHPDEQTDDVLLRDLGSSYSPYCENTGALVYAFDNSDRHFLLYDREEVPKPEVETETTDLSGIDGTQVEEGIDDSDSIDGEVYQYQYDAKEHYSQRLDAFVDWVNDIIDSGDDEANDFKGQDGYSPEYIISNNAFHVTVDFPIALSNEIDKGTWCEPDYLSASTSVTFSYDIYPLYVHYIAGQTEAQAGDYYIVDGSFTVHNGPMWKPAKVDHGWFNNRIIGYYMTGADVLFELLNENEDPKKPNSPDWNSVYWEDAAPRGNENHLYCLEFYHQPSPGTCQSDVTYSEGVTYGMSLTASGKVSKAGPEASVSGGFSATWSKNVSQTLSDVHTMRLTDSRSRVGYSYTVNNIMTKRDWGDWNKHYPAVSRGDFTAGQTWIWKVPYGTNEVGENSNKKFLFNISYRGHYGTFNWWRGASWDKTGDFNTGLCTQYVQIAPPSREPFGVLTLKNAGEETIGNIRMTRVGTTVVRKIPSSYGYNETASIKLPAGQYLVEYDVVDTKTHKVVSSWRYEDVVVVMGADERSSTTLLSTIEFDQVR